MAWWDHEELKSPNARSDRYKVNFPEGYSKREVEEAQQNLDSDRANEASKKSSTISDTKDNLTPPGWPRPRFGVWPVPWVSPKNDLSKLDPDRLDEIRTNFICQVCGQGHKPDDTIYMICNGAMEGTDTNVDLKEKVVLSMDQSILHKHCCQMSITLCPRLKRLKAEGHMIIVSALHKYIDVWDNNSGDDQVGVQGKYATLVGDKL